MSPKRLQSSAQLALLSAAVLLLVTACGEEKSEPANQGTAPTTQGSAPSTEQPAAPEAGQTAPKQ
jgi:outer membrane biogenesis lipoprotein LolB